MGWCLKMKFEKNGIAQLVNPTTMKVEYVDINNIILSDGYSVKDLVQDVASLKADLQKQVNINVANEKRFKAILEALNELSTNVATAQIDLETLQEKEQI